MVAVQLPVDVSQTYKVYHKSTPGIEITIDIGQNFLPLSGTSQWTLDTIQKTSLHFKERNTTLCHSTNALNSGNLSMYLRTETRPVLGGR